MPARAIFLAVAAAITAGIVAYHEREKLLEFVELSRRKITMSLHQIAKDLGPRQREEQMEHPMTGRGSLRPRTPPEGDEECLAEEKALLLDEKSAEAEAAHRRDEDTFGTASGWEGNDGVAVGMDFRHRGPSPLPPSAPANDSVLFDAATNTHTRSSTPVGIAEKVPGSVTSEHVSRRSSSATLSGNETLPNPPLALPQHAVAETRSASQQIPVAVGNANSSRTASSSGEFEERQPENPFGNAAPYWSIHEWAENAATLDSGSTRSNSVAGSVAEEIPRPADEVLSEFGSEDESVGSWTDVGSSVNSDDEN